MLIELYEKSGDAIAQQYAGSQLVHRVDTYNKNSIASQLRDNVHTISRYYSNAFSDADKQNAMNLFLGIYEPSLYHNTIPIWDLVTDMYLHDKFLTEPWKLSKRYCEWIDSKTFFYLPNAIDEEKTLEKDSKTIELLRQENYRIDHFENFYKPHKLSVFHEIYYFNILQVNRITGQVSSSLTSGLKAMLFDPLMGNKKVTKQNVSNVSLLNAQSNASEDSDTTDDSSLALSSTQYTKSPIKSLKPDDIKKSSVINNKIDENPQEVTIIIQSEKTALVYKNFLEQKFIPNTFCHTIKRLKNGLEEVVEPKVSIKATQLYNNHLSVGKYGPKEPSITSIKKYEDYLKLK